MSAVLVHLANHQRRKIHGIIPSCNQQANVAANNQRPRAPI
jgi:hypothetical protein